MKPHFTLRPVFNAVLILLWGTVIICMGLFYRPIPMVLIVMSAVAGIVVGLLQKMSLEKNLSDFMQAGTALNVRHMLASTKEGKRAIVLQWCAVIAMVIIALSQHLPNINAIWDIVFGYVTLMFCRELITFGDYPLIARI